MNYDGDYRLVAGARVPRIGRPKRNRAKIKAGRRAARR